MHEVEQVRAEGDGRCHRRHGHDQAEQGTAHRDSGAPLARVEGEPHARHGGHRRAGARQPFGSLRAAAWHSRCVALSGMPGRCQAPGGPGSPREQQDHGHGEADGQHRGVDAQAGIGLRKTGRPDRHQRRGRDRHAARGCRSGGHRRADLSQACRQQLAAGHPERREGAIVRRCRQQQPRRYLADDEQRGDSENQREQGQSDRLRPDRSLDGGRLPGLIREEYLAAASGELAGERLGPGAEVAHRLAWPQLHVCPVRSRIARAELAEQRLAGDDDWSLIQIRDGNDGAAVHHDSDDALGQPANVPGVRSGAGAQLQPAADPKVQVPGGDLVDHHLAGAMRPRLAPGEHLRELERVAEPAVQRRSDYGINQFPAGSHRQRLQPDDRCDRRHSREAGKRIIVIAAESLAGRPDEHVRPLICLQEPGIRTCRPPRARGRREHRAARQADKQHQDSPAQPPGVELMGGKAQDGPHCRQPAVAWLASGMRPRSTRRRS